MRLATARAKFSPELAAERGYWFFLAKHEAYRSALGPRERSRAIEVGASLRAEFGDEAALPRLQARMDNARNLLVPYKDNPGSTRTLHRRGSNGTLQGLRSDHYLADVFETEGYRAWADTTLEAVGKGRVEVLPLSKAAPPATSAVEGNPW